MSEALIALDQSSSNVGWVIFLDGEFESGGVLKPDPPDYDLLRYWIKDMVGTLKGEGYAPEVVVEAIYMAFFGGKPQVQTFKVLAQTQAHIWAAARDMNVPISEVKAFDAMKALTGIADPKTKREVRKLAMIESASRLIGETVSEHEADAYGLALAHLNAKQAIPVVG